MHFSIIDQTTDASAGDIYGGPLTRPLLDQIAAALMVYANRDVATYWGGDHVVNVVASDVQLIASAIPCRIVDALPDDPQAIAYHSGDNDYQAIWVAKTQLNSLLVGADSLSCALGHEIAETIGDPGCNRWAMGSLGLLFAIELSDFDEQSTYDCEGVSAPNFALPSFFVPGSVGPWSYLGATGAETVAGPLRTAPGGYQLTLNSNNKVQVMGELAPHRRARKRHPTSRSYRRGLRL